MPIPRPIRNKIDAYTAELENRYPPVAVSYKISVGYGKAGDAVNDLDPATTIYTNDDLAPDIDSLLYTNAEKTESFDGGNLWYHVFRSNGEDLLFIILVDRGTVGNKISTE
jgi:hypothetical protein